MPKPSRLSAAIALRDAAVTRVLQKAQKSEITPKGNTRLLEEPGLLVGYTEPIAEAPKLDPLLYGEPWLLDIWAEKKS